MTNDLTGAQAGLSADDQVAIALQAIESAGGATDIQTIYRAVEQKMSGHSLSDQGKASLRRIVNTYAVRAGFIYPHNQHEPGWRITPEGREYLVSTHEPSPIEQVIDIDSHIVKSIPSNTVRGAIFERHIGMLLKQMYPGHAWIQTGIYKRNERGLDFYGAALAESESRIGAIGAQVKLHAPNNAPTEVEWLKFLGGCFARRIELALFVTTGRLTGEQFREAVEARVVVLSGLDEINRQCARFSVDPFVEIAFEGSLSA